MGVEDGFASGKSEEEGQKIDQWKEGRKNPGETGGGMAVQHIEDVGWV